MAKLIILDRDGVINHDSPEFIKSPSEWEPIAGAPQAISRLNQAGYRVAVATNQSGIARGLLSVADLGAIHQKMCAVAQAAGGKIAATAFCPHGPEDECACRKPAPGMLEWLGEYFGIDLAGVPVVGDSLRDLQAAAAVGCTPVLVLTGNGKKTQGNGGLPAGTLVFEDLAAVAYYLASR